MAIMVGSVSNPPIVSRGNLTHLTRAQFDPYMRHRGEKLFYFITAMEFTKGRDFFSPPTVLGS